MGWLRKYDDGGEVDPPGKKTVLKNTKVGEMQTVLKSDLDLRPVFKNFKDTEEEIIDPNCTDPDGIGCSKQATTFAQKITGLPYQSYAPSNAGYRDATAKRIGMQNIFDQSVPEQKANANSRKYGWSYPTEDDYKKFKAGDVVTLDAGSDIFLYGPEKGYTEADNSGTSHNGVIVGFNETGVPIIRHGAARGKGKGTSRTEVLGTDQRVSGFGRGKYAIKSVWRPKEITDNNEVTKIDNIVESADELATRKQKTTSNIQYYLKNTSEEKLIKDLPVAAEFSGTTVRQKTKEELLSYFNDEKLNNELKYKLGLTDTDLKNLQPVIYGVAGQEGKFGHLDKIGTSIKEEISKVKGKDDSKGLFQIKYSSLTPNERDVLDIKTPSDLLDNKKAYQAAILLMANSKKRMDSEVEKGTHPELADKDPYFRAAYYYNQPARAINTAQEWGKNSNPVTLNPATWLNNLSTRERPGVFAKINKDYVSKKELRMDEGSYPYKLMQAAKDLGIQVDETNPALLEEVVVRAASGKNKKYIPKEAYGGQISPAWLNKYK